MFATRWWRVLDKPGGSDGVDNAFARQHDTGIGAEIMGARKFGYPGWYDDPEWKGWWGPNPPFHTPVFVLAHHPRRSMEMEGGTTFHFIDASPVEALETARKAAAGQDVRIGGGVRLWDGQEGLEKDYEVEATSSPSGVTHMTFTRAGL